MDMAVLCGTVMSVFYFAGSFVYGELSKKSCFVEWNFLPMSMNTH